MVLQTGYDNNTEQDQSALKRQTMTDCDGDKTGADSVMYGNDDGTYRPVKVNSDGELVVAIGS